MSFDLLLRAFFTDSGAGAGLAKLNAGIKDVEKASPGGARGLLAIERGLSTLAAEAVGIQGPVGRVAEGLLRFGGGTGLVLGAVAGIGIIGEAYKLSAAEAEKLSAAHDKLAASYDRVLARGKPQVQAQSEARDAVKTARDELERLRNPSLSASVIGFITPGDIAQAQENYNAALRQQNQIRVEGMRAQDDAVASAGREAMALELTNAIRARAIETGAQERDTLVQVTRVTAEAAAAAAHLDSTHTAAFVANQIRIAQGKEENKVLEAQRDLLVDIEQISAEVSRAMGKINLADIQVPSLKDVMRGPEFRKSFSALDEGRLDASTFFARGVGKSAEKEGIEAARGKDQHIDTAAIAASALAVVGALKQGGAAGIFGAAGGLASELGQIKGLAGFTPVGIGLNVLSGITGLFGGLDAAAERRHQEKEARDQQRHEELVGVIAHGPERSTNTFLGSSPEESLYESRRLDRLGGEPRLGG